MKSPKTFFLTLILSTITIHAMDLEKGEQSPSLLEQLKIAAAEHDNVAGTKTLIKQIKKLKKTEAQKTIKKFNHWLHEQLQDQREHVINGRMRLKEATGENAFAVLVFCSAYLGLLGEPLALPILGSFAFVLAIIWAIETGLSFKHFNKAEPIAISNNEVRQTLLLLDQVKLKKIKKKTKK